MVKEKKVPEGFYECHHCGRVLPDGNACGCGLLKKMDKEKEDKDVISSIW